MSRPAIAMLAPAVARFPGANAALRLLLDAAAERAGFVLSGEPGENRPRPVLERVTAGLRGNLQQKQIQGR